MTPKKASKKTVKKVVKATSRQFFDVDTDDSDKYSGGLDFRSIFGKAVESVVKKDKLDVTDLDGITKSALVGVPFGNFALEVCFNETVLGLGRLICLDGMPASCKLNFRLLYVVRRIVL